MIPGLEDGRPREDRLQLLPFVYEIRLDLSDASLSQFQRYGELIEKKLALFLSENSKDANELYTACLEEKLENENGWAVCLDYLIASLDYEYFLQVAFDLYNLQ